MGFGKDGKGAIVKEFTSFALAGLAGQDLILANAGVSLDQSFRILKTILTATLTGITSLEGAGLMLYMTTGDLTEPSVEANIEQNGPVSRGDPAATEVAGRWVRLVAVSPNATVNLTERSMLNEHGGAILTVKPRWTFIRRRTATEGGWNWGIYNNGVTLTTGTTCRIAATHYGVWVD